MRTIVLLVVGVSCSWALSLQGFVRDRTSGEPLPAANVWLEGTALGTTANADGFFVITGLAPGAYVLQVSYVGYHPFRMRVDLTGLTGPLSVELVPQAVAMEEVEVVAEREATHQRTGARVSSVPLPAATLRGVPSLGAEMDVLRVVQAIPGVKASSDLSTAPYIRGGTPDQTLILMDHAVVYNPSHMFGLFSTFNGDAVKRVDLLKGGFPAEYGGRSGSVMEVITKEGNRQRHEGVASLGVVSARGALEGPVANRGSYAVSARRTYLEPIVSILRRTSGSDLPDYHFFDANGKLNLDLSQRSTLTISGYGGEDVMHAEFGDADERLSMRLAWGNRSAGIRYRHLLGQGLFAALGITSSRYHSQWFLRADEVLLERFHNRLSDYTFRVDLEGAPSPSHRLKGGVSLTDFQVAFGVSGHDIEWVRVDSSTSHLASYIQDTWSPAPWLELQAGIRAAYHRAGGHLCLDPRGAVVWRTQPNARLKLAGGRYSQWINVITFGEGFSNFDTWVPVDGSIKPGSTRQTVVALEFDPSPVVETTLEAYYNHMDNLATYNMMVDRGSRAADAFLMGEGYAWGMEAMVRKTHGDLTGWIGYCLSWTRRRFPGSYLNEGKWFYPRWDRRHDFIVVAQRRLSPSWEASASWRYHTGQGYTQPVGLYTSREPGVPPDWEQADGRVILPGPLNNARFPADHRLDLTLTYRHRLAGRPASLTVAVYNVYSRRSYWMRYVDTDENPVEVHDLKLLPVLPLVSYEVRW